MSSHVAWLDHCGFNQLLSPGELLTFQALMKAEERLSSMNSKYWSEKVFGGWFRVNVGSELTIVTGLTERSLTTHLRSLEDDWRLIRVQREKHHPTKVWFNMLAIRALAVYAVARLDPYQGGARGLEELPEKFYFWIRPDQKEYAKGISRGQLKAEMLRAGSTRPTTCGLRDIIVLF